MEVYDLENPNTDEMPDGLKLGLEIYRALYEADDSSLLAATMSALTALGTFLHVQLEGDEEKIAEAIGHIRELHLNSAGCHEVLTGYTEPMPRFGGAFWK